MKMKMKTRTLNVGLNRLNISKNIERKAITRGEKQDVI